MLMNGAPKFVFSRTLDKASWTNTTLLRGDLTTEVRKLKAAAGSEPGDVGSGSIVGAIGRCRID